MELGHDDAAELPLTVRQFAERIGALYWHQPSLLKARTLADYAALVTKVAAVVSAQPLTYLQNLRGATDPFLYRRNGAGRITLGPGVAYCLRRFYPLVQQLSRSRWVAHIKDNRRNRAVLGKDADLEAFLFSASQESLEQVGRLLRKLEGSHCFYCGGSVADGDIDHFIPFALYPRDLTGNFVLTHPTCNRNKSDTLAARPHLERWLEQGRPDPGDRRNRRLAGRAEHPAQGRGLGLWERLQRWRQGVAGRRGAMSRWMECTCGCWRTRSVTMRRHDAG